MIRILSYGIDIIAAAVILIPTLLIEKRCVFERRNHILSYIIFALYLSAVYVVVGLPSIIYLRFDLNINLIPFSGLIGDLENSILNIILFIPLGIALPFFWSKRISIKQVILFGFIISLSIEILQVLTLRATDVNDLIMNTLGTIVGYLITKCFIGKHTVFISNKSERDIYILVGTVFVVMFFIQPFVLSIL